MKTFRKNQNVRVKDFVRLKDAGLADTVVNVMNYLVSNSIVDNNFHVKDKVTFNKLWNEYC